MKKLCLLLFAVLGGALFAADIEREFAPPLKLTGEGARLLQKDYKFLPTPSRGATFIVTARYLPETPMQKNGIAAFLCKKGEFLFGLRLRRLYFLPADAGDGSWNYSAFQGGVRAMHPLKGDDTSLHQFVATVSRYVEPEQSIDYTDVKLYQDGALVAGKRFDHFVWRDSGHPLLFGGVPAGDRKIGDRNLTDRHWFFAGELENIRVLERVLSEDEIRAMVLADPRLKPGFPMPKKLSAEEKRLLAPKPDAPAAEKGRLSALANAAYQGRLDWRRVCRVPAAKAAKGGRSAVYVMPDTESVATVIDDGEYADVTSFYDAKADREMLAWNNPFFEVVGIDAEKRQYELSGSAATVTRRLSMKPRRENGVWRFAFEGKHEPEKEFPFAFDYTLEFSYAQNRLAYTLAVRSTSPNGRLHSVRFPMLRINSFRKGNDTLLVPRMTGVEYRDASALSVTYAGSYPQGHCSLQMGAYYDPAGGVMAATEDPRGRPKQTSFAIGREISEISFGWSVPFREVVGPNLFEPKCEASLTLFRGNWYDAGLAYRAMLDRIGPPWWSRSLPNGECPKWFRENILWIGRWQEFKNYARWLGQYDDLVKWKKYVGSLGQALHFYEWCLHFTRDWPHNPANPDFVQRTRAMQRAGYRVVPYIDGRLWDEHDKRDEDYRFTKFGKPAIVTMLNGQPQTERHTTTFHVICPATPIFENEMFRECDNCVIHSADGVYVDQIGASIHHPCYSLSHGHLGADPDLWYMQGHYKVFRKLREHWKSFAPEAITLCEDIAETTVNTFDGGMTYRWQFDGQVPLFPLVYAGRTQFVGLAWGRDHRTIITHEDLDAVPAKLAWQLFTGSQLGWFSIDYLVHPRMRPYRPLIRKYAYWRWAMLDFFNAGMMVRPPRFVEPQKAIVRYWNKHGSGNVAAEPLQACAWEHDGVTAVLVANADGQPRKNVLTVRLPKGALHFFRSGGAAEVRKIAGGETGIPVELAPGEFFTALAIPEGKNADAILKRFAGAFREIAATDAMTDPWPETKPEERK